MTRIEFYGHVLTYDMDTSKWTGADEAVVWMANGTDVLAEPSPSVGCAWVESIEKLKAAFPGRVKVLSADEPDEEPDIEGAVF